MNRPNVNRIYFPPLTRLGSVSLATLLFGALFVPEAEAVDNDIVHTNRHRLSISARFGVNMRARFTGIGNGVAGGGAAIAASSGQNRVYDDGYVRVDSSDNAGGQTWNWGYESPDQIQGNTILMHTTTMASGGAASSAASIADDPHHGFELMYAVEFMPFKYGRWGFEFGLNYMNISVHDTQPRQAAVGVMTDAYSFEPGTTPPEAPYQGTFDGPGFTINATPIRTMAAAPGGATILGSRDFDVHLIGLKFGPFVEFALGRKMSLYLSGGPMMALAISDLRWRESLSGTTTTASAHGGDEDLLGGFYVGAQLHYAINRNWTAFIGAGYEYLTAYYHQEQGVTAQLETVNSVVTSFGFGWSF